MKRITPCVKIVNVVFNVVFLQYFEVIGYCHEKLHLTLDKDQCGLKYISSSILQRCSVVCFKRKHAAITIINYIQIDGEIDIRRQMASVTSERQCNTGYILLFHYRFRCLQPRFTKQCYISGELPAL